MMENRKKEDKPVPKICFLVESFYPMIGGCETHGRRFVEGFLEKGAKVFHLSQRR
jgi:hypothetical protein